jgi:hypothetical protein
VGAASSRSLGRKGGEAVRAVLGIDMLEKFVAPDGALLVPWNQER